MRISRRYAAARFTAFALLPLALGCGGAGSSSSASTASPVASQAAPSRTARGTVPAAFAGLPGASAPSLGSVAPRLISTAPGASSAATPAAAGALTAPGAVPSVPASAPAQPAAARPSRPASAASSFASGRPAGASGVVAGAAERAAPAGATGGRSPAGPPMQGGVDTDGDGLDDATERQMKTDPRGVDTDGDGILDARDLAPRFGKAGYGAFRATYPPGATHREARFRAVGLSGRSKVERTIFGRLEKVHYEGTKGTRRSSLAPRPVLDALESRFAKTDFAPVTASPAGRAFTFGSHRFEKAVLARRYTIDYDFRGRRYAVGLRNRKDYRVTDANNRPFGSKVFPVRVSGGADSTLILQVTVDRGADRFAYDPTGETTVLAATYQVFDGEEKKLLEAELVRDDAATGAVLNRYAYELRLPLGTPRARGERTWTVVVTPVWVTQRAGETSVAAIRARALDLGAVAHEMTLFASDRRSVRATGIYSGVEDLTSDLRRQVAATAWDQVQQSERKVVQKGDPDDVEWVMTQLKTTSKVASTSKKVLVVVDEQSKTVKGQKLTDVLDERDATRYKAAIRHLETADRGSTAVLEGLQAVVAYQEGDHLAAAVYGAKSAKETVQLLDHLKLVRSDRAKKASTGLGLAANGLETADAINRGDTSDAVKSGAKAAGDGVQLASQFGRVSEGRAKKVATGLDVAVNGFNAYEAWRDGDPGKATVYTARGGAALARYYYADASWAIGKHKVPAGTVITVALGVVDVGYDLYRARNEDDPIVRQYYLESAAATAVDVGITLIPTVGPAIQVVWGTAWLVATFIEPDLAQYRMFSSPGAFVTYVGIVVFTKEIPSAVAEAAYEEAVEELLEEVERLEKRGTPCAVVLPAS